MVARVFHCDDSDAYRMLVRELLADEPGVEHVGEAADAAAAIAGVSAVSPDVVLLDLRGADLGVELVGRLRAAAPGTEVLILSGWPGPVDLSGAAGRLDKDVTPARLAAAIRAVARGGAF